MELEIFYFLVSKHIYGIFMKVIPADLRVVEYAVIGLGYVGLAHSYSK